MAAIINGINSRARRYGVEDAMADLAESLHREQEQSGELDENTLTWFVEQLRTEWPGLIDVLTRRQPKGFMGLVAIESVLFLRPPEEPATEEEIEPEPIELDEDQLRREAALRTAVEIDWEVLPRSRSDATEMAAFLLETLREDRRSRPEDYKAEDLTRLDIVIAFWDEFGGTLYRRRRTFDMPASRNSYVVLVFEYDGETYAYADRTKKRSAAYAYTSINNDEEWHQSLSRPRSKAQKQGAHQIRHARLATPDDHKKRALKKFKDIGMPKDRVLQAARSMELSDISFLEDQPSGTDQSQSDEVS